MGQGNASSAVASKSILILGGASSGSIGFAISERLTVMGHECNAPSEMDFDVVRSDDEQWADLINWVSPDAVVYSVGINKLDWSSNITAEDFDEIMRTNVWGFVRLLQALQATGPSYSVLAITSDAAVRPMRTSLAYCASKAALNMAIRVAARELSGEGWRINGLAPGKVEGTNMTLYVDERVMQIRHFQSRGEAERYEMAGNPLGRKLYTAEVAAAACDILLSDALGWTGDIITVNGGR